jgi:hypothetical protein
MSATKEFCKQQVARLRVIPVHRPATEQAAKDWVDTLTRHCRDNEHAERAMTRFIETVKDTENPIAELIAVINETIQRGQPPDGCERCSLGPDPNTGAARWSAHVAGERGGYTVAMRCRGIDGKGCARGQWLEVKDRERAVSTASEERRMDFTAARDVKVIAGGNQ